MAGHHIETAQRIQEKFHFYLVGLSFTVLGLSIQTSTFRISLISDCLELIGWVCLLFSGIIGLLRFEREPFLHQKADAASRLKADRKDFREALLSGEKQIFIKGEGLADTAVEIQKIEDDIAKIEAWIKKDQDILIRKYAVHKYSFVAGIISLVVGRGFVPLKGLIQAICQ